MCWPSRHPHTTTNRSPPLWSTWQPLSDEAREAKQVRRRLEGQNRQSGIQSNRPTVRHAMPHETVSQSPQLMTSRTNSKKCLATSAPAGELHSDYCTASTKLPTTMLSLLSWTQLSVHSVVKVNRIHDDICQALQSSAFAVQPHQGPALSSFQPVMIQEIRKLFCQLYQASCHHLMHCRILCWSRAHCSEVFAPTVVRLANLSLRTGKFQAATKEHRCYHCWKKPDSTAHRGRTTDQFPIWQPSPRSSRDLCWLPDSSATTFVRFYQLQRVPVCLLEGTFYGECIAGGSGWQWRSQEFTRRSLILIQVADFRINVKKLSF